ncbi:AEC family transporter [Streptacidiphilus fuscans]|uniref:AEC family transporter n=1 Tax=Streptacidiphilus fuscans TaxID=2789292 RepID=A0A931AWC2_9ACTN|nr:AEC family transporter [Streptacidiphilus fuscans]MBF9066674.1 AEC family transporter [Streptacidiphilus fuscans]
MSLLGAFIPIWILTAVGYAARRRGLLSETAGSALGRFVFHMAMPAALFMTLSATPMAGYDYRALLAFGASTAVVIGVGWLGVSRLYGRKAGERPVWGMAAGYVNSANLGIPIAQQVLHSVSFLAEVVLLQTLVVTPVILIALDRHGDSAGRVRLRRIASLPFRNPVILGSALGVVWSAAHLPVPHAVSSSLELLAGAAVPVALIALGASLHSESGLKVPPAETAVITVLKLVAQPLVALVFGVALHLTGAELLAVVVCAGLPTAQNTFIFAQEYGVGEALASRVVIVTTLFSLGTLAAAAALLQR